MLPEFSTTVPASMCALVSLLLRATALETPTPTLPPTAAAPAMDVEVVSLLLSSSNAPRLPRSMEEFAPMAVSVRSLNTLTAKAPDTAAVSPAAPAAASL